VTSRALFLSTIVLVGCAGAQHSTRQIEAQIRQLREEQERQAHQIELLEHRVILAEDSARLARHALTVSGVRATARSGEARASEAEPIPSAAAPGSTEGPPEGTPHAEHEPASVRPVVRASGRQRAPESAIPIVVHDGDRLPVVPVAPAPGPSSAPSAPS